MKKPSYTGIVSRVEILRQIQGDRVGRNRQYKGWTDSMLYSTVIINIIVRTYSLSYFKVSKVRFDFLLIIKRRGLSYFMTQQG